MDKHVLVITTRSERTYELEIPEHRYQQLKREGVARIYLEAVVDGETCDSITIAPLERRNG